MIGLNKTGKGIVWEGPNLMLQESGTVPEEATCKRRAKNIC